MDTERAVEHSHRGRAARPRCFTVESANAALVLVRKVVRDIVGSYGELMTLRAERQERAFTPEARERFEQLSAGIDRLVERVKWLREELADIGCEPKDLVRGLVDFPAMFAGCKILLCWALDEPEVAFWHDPGAGFAGRRPIDAEFRRRAGESPSTGIEQPPAC